MTHLPRIVTGLGLLATFFAIILNLVPSTAATAKTLAIQSLTAAVIAITCGVYVFRQGGGWRFLAIAMIGPGVFTLMEAAMQIALSFRSL